LFGSSSVYTPVGDQKLSDLAQPGPTPLERVGAVSLGPEKPVSVMFTGGAVSSDGSAIALRSYSDLYLYEVVDGGIGATLTDTEPLRIPLPTEPQGEAVAFNDAGDVLIGSESAGGALPPVHVMRALVEATESTAVSSGDSVGVGVDPWTFVWAGLVAAGCALGGVAFVRSRRRH